MWTHHICVTRTGQPLTEVFPSAATWNRVMNRVGPGASATFELADPVNEKLRNSSLTDDGTRTLTTSWNGVMRDAKLITDTDLDFDDERLTVGLEDVRAVFNDRYPFGSSSYWLDEPNKLPNTFSVVGWELRSIMSLIVRESLVGPFDLWSLPIVRAAEVGGAHSRDYANYNFRTTNAILTELQETLGGPDLDFVPRWSPTTGWLEWVMVTGTDAAPAISGPPLDFHLNTAEPGLTELRRRRDGKERKTGAFGVGAGSNRDMLVYGWGTGQDGDTTSVARDVMLPMKSVDNIAEVEAQTRAAIAANRNSTEQWSFKFVADGDSERDLGNVPLGTIAKIHRNGSPFMSTEQVSLRVIGLSGDMSNVITPSLQQIVVA